MKNINRIIALALMCVLVLGAIPASANALDETNTAVPISAQVFDDVAPGAWYYEAVNNMAQGGLLVGYSDGLFHPDDEITYGMFATILCRITGTTTEHIYNFTPEHWAADAIENICRKTGIFSRGSAYADESLWRAEALEVMVSFAKRLSKYNFSANTQITEKVWTWDDIPDADAVMDWNHGIHNWSKPRILAAYNLGITSGVDKIGTCNPTGVMTRAQLCQMLYNMGICKANSVNFGVSGAH